ncbi:hypothetical protein EJ063_07600 [Vibrio aquaticus]|uniref:Uncharacterized protein n=1 Tax=Vibrio aquaticus TaxID=2496559 RepID=A0A3S0PPY2_9VIBR|nr:hypothetical protein [Vibrio aquaticus]RTZ16649.1 hypothetical protein EJ063_07600 [Vibrio aquaticus]
MGRISHFNLNKNKLDPYALIVSKLSRLSWNGSIDVEQKVDKRRLIEWFALLRDYSDESAEKILCRGLLDNEFHNITFTLQLAQNKDFYNMPSNEFYELIFNFVDATPECIKDCLTGHDYSMSREVLALLSKKR